MPTNAAPTPRSNWFPPFAAPTPRSSAGVSAGLAADDSFPGIEQFIDELPSIADYAGEPNSGSVETPGARSDSNDGARSDSDDGTWRMSEWQSLDLRKLATLGLHSPAREDGQMRAGRGVAGTQTREEIAAAFDSIAGRIRRGELPLDKFGEVHPEVAMAISLAALFRLKP